MRDSLPNSVWHTDQDMERLPVRLKRDPIMQVVAECRFVPTTAGAASSILPGYFFQKRRKEFTGIEQLPEAQIPAQVRALDVNLKYRALHQLKSVTDKEKVLVGDHVLSLLVEGDYPGWQTLKPKILSLWNDLRESDIVRSVERFSVQYTNLLEAPLGGNHFEKINAAITLGGVEIAAQPTTLQTEFADGGPIVKIVQIASQATALQRDVPNPARHGLVVVVDVVHKGPFKDFWRDSENLLEAVHNAEKEQFFALLTDDLLKHYVPEY